MPNDLAAMLRRRYRVSGVPSDRDIDRMVRGEGLRIMEYPLAGRIRELLYEDCLIIRTDQSRRWKRWVKLHGLAHWLLHDGNQLYMDGANSVIVRKQEKQAERFAGHIVWHEIEPHELGHSIYSLAEYAEVPELCALRWWTYLLEDCVIAQEWSINLAVGQAGIIRGNRLEV